MVEEESICWEFTRVPKSATSSSYIITAASAQHGNGNRRPGIMSFNVI